MKTHPFTRQIQANNILYITQLIRLVYSTKKRKILKQSLQRLQDLNLKDFDRITSNLSWELQGIEQDIATYKDWLEWYKSKPNWIALG